MKLNVIEHNIYLRDLLKFAENKVTEKMVHNLPELKFCIRSYLIQ